ncbi:hypothetical protein [uncultured Halopseudomonas sp.]|uniref:hypothetical protein n=1 Tax=uncultured Halopseudomonas sp. TaxID=2901193 RepID=UPI0030EBD957|tara:strand:- start:13421 stop:13840 length:420 start_codon:yes stop_codon:yes gene_type:complete
MTSYEIWYIATLIALLFVPFLLAYPIRGRFDSKRGLVLTIFLSAALMSGVVIANLAYNDWVLDQEIAVLDRDGDGFWSEEEEASWTEGEQRLMQSYIGDGGRNGFAVIIFPIFSFFYSTIVATLLWLAFHYIERRKSNA